MIDTYVNFDTMAHTFVQAGDGEDNNFVNMVISPQVPGAGDIHVERCRKILKVVESKRPMTYLFSNELKTGNEGGWDVLVFFPSSPPPPPPPLLNKSRHYLQPLLMPHICLLLFLKW